MNVFRSRSISYSNGVTIHLELLEILLLVQNFINCKVKVNISPFNLILLGSSSSKRTVVVMETDFFNFLNVAGSQKILNPEIES